ncbi:hypothetical protein KKH56_01875 [bacterium]|nr:hypothetical protein [bacterium]
MTVKYVNCKGDAYYLHQGKTRTGKPKYFFSRKKDGILVEKIPDGYEIYENPNAQVFLRKIPPKIFTDEEISVVKDGVKNVSKLKDFKIDVKGNQIIIFLPNQDVDSLEEIFSDFLGCNNPGLNQLLKTSLTYSPMMRFVLTDERDREFQVERMCFLGSIDNWIYLGGGDLKKLVKRYCPHLGKESFFELI